MRHAEVAYFEPDGRPLRPESVPLTPEGENQARAARDALAGVHFDRSVTSGLKRTLETAQIVAPGVEPEVWPDLRELESGRLGDISDAVLHGGVNRAILSYALTAKRTFLGNFEQAPACVNILDQGAEHWVVRAVNVTPYDLAHLGGRQTTMEQLYGEYLPYRKRP